MRATRCNLAVVGEVGIYGGDIGAGMRIGAPGFTIGPNSVHYYFGSDGWNMGNTEDYTSGGKTLSGDLERVQNYKRQQNIKK